MEGLPTSVGHVRFGSKADIGEGATDVRFAPKSGHRNRHAYHLRRSNSGSFVTLAAMRRVSSFVSILAAERHPGSSK